MAGTLLGKMTCRGAAIAFWKGPGGECPPIYAYLAASRQYLNPLFRLVVMDFSPNDAQPGQAGQPNRLQLFLEAQKDSEHRFRGARKLIRRGEGREEVRRLAYSSAILKPETHMWDHVEVKSGAIGKQAPRVPPRSRNHV